MSQKADLYPHKKYWRHIWYVRERKERLVHTWALGSLHMFSMCANLSVFIWTCRSFCLFWVSIACTFWMMSKLVFWFYFIQANPHEPKTFPFILLGNKIDIDGGNSRVVRNNDVLTWPRWALPSLSCLADYYFCRSLRRKPGNGVLQKKIFLTSRHQLKKTTMLMLLFCALPRLH